MLHRTTTVSRPASHAHLVDANVAALTVRPSTGGTRKPDPLRRPDACSASNASVTSAIDAYAIAASSTRCGGRDVPQQP